MDVYLGPMGKGSAFVFRVPSDMDTEQIIEKLASIIGVAPNNMVVTDMNGGERHYPEGHIHVGHGPCEKIYTGDPTNGP